MSWMLSVRGALAGTANTRAEGEEWITYDTTNYLPSLHKRLRTHGAVTVGVPYMYHCTAAYPGGLTAACATNPRAYIAFAAETTTAAGYADFIIAGYVKDAVSSGTIAAGANVEVINSTPAAVIDDGTTAIHTANTLGHALDAAASNVIDLWVLESPVAINAT